jgi:hypothetical protein
MCILGTLRLVGPSPLVAVRCLPSAAQTKHLSRGETVERGKRIQEPEYNEYKRGDSCERPEGWRVQSYSQLLQRSHIHR